MQHLPAFKTGVKAQLVERVEESILACVNYSFCPVLPSSPSISESECFDDAEVDVNEIEDTGQKDIIEPLAFAKRLKSEV